MQGQGRELKALAMSKDTTTTTSPWQTASCAMDFTLRTAWTVDLFRRNPNWQSARSGPTRSRCSTRRSAALNSPLSRSSRTSRARTNARPGMPSGPGAVFLARSLSTAAPKLVPGDLGDFLPVLEPHIQWWSHTGGLKCRSLREQSGNHLAEELRLQALRQGDAVWPSLVTDQLIRTPPWIAIQRSQQLLPGRLPWRPQSRSSARLFASTRAEHKAQASTSSSRRRLLRYRAYWRLAAMQASRSRESSGDHQYTHLLGGRVLVRGIDASHQHRCHCAPEPLGLVLNHHVYWRTGPGFVG
ncbi:unnamed protein product [Trichogramma brassicae]|uniref:Uncharacterized protein n=1 Tax=Trichogramma brassicae TaxID=86971 RepID=A0A6H5I104_9HYME|nr:unnamed protein product [Trichogramma brassicae]